MSAIPAVCYKCGYTFISPFDLIGSRNCKVTGCSTNCPRCGGDVSVPDGFTDSQGTLHVKELFNYVQEFNDTKILSELKNNLEAANDAITARELVENLTEIEPSFAKFKSAIQAIPATSIPVFITILLSLITLVIMYQSWQSSEENHDESMDVQRAQLELSREQFEHQKQKDDGNEIIQNQAEKERELIRKQIEELRLEFDRKFSDLEEENTRMPSKKAL